MTRDELAQDLSYVRALAEEGRHAPLLGGSFLVFWGVLNMAAYGVQWSLLTGLLPGAESGASFGLLWGAYGLIAGIGSAILSQRVRGKPGLSAIGVRAEGAIWLGVSLAIGAVAIGAIARLFLDHDVNAPNAIMGAAFALFGAALTATAMLSGQKWLWPFALLAYLVAATLCAFANAPWAYLLASAASVIVLAIPGALLLRHEPSAIV